MTANLSFDISPQPDYSTCGPTCLQAVYRYYNDPVEHSQLVQEVLALQEGGTLAVFLACHALKRGYRAHIYTYNWQVFDPTWFTTPGVDLAHKLKSQSDAKHDEKLHHATEGYLEFLRLGGHLRFEDLTLTLIRKYLTRGVPILTGLSATYLYHMAREFGPECVTDDIKGHPVGHFVVLCGYERRTRQVLVADPLDPNPLDSEHIYPMSIERVLGAILLGIVTYDANLLIIEPKQEA